MLSRRSKRYARLDRRDWTEPVAYAPRGGRVKGSEGGTQHAAISNGKNGNGNDGNRQPSTGNSAGAMAAAVCRHAPLLNAEC